MGFRPKSTYNWVYNTYNKFVVLNPSMRAAVRKFSRCGWHCGYRGNELMQNLRGRVITRGLPRIFIAAEFKIIVSR